MRFSLPALAALTLLWAMPAQANLIQNGGFETGDFTGWNVAAVGSSVEAATGLGPHGGTYFAQLSDPRGCCGNLIQIVSDNPGDALTLSFWLANDGPSSSYFSVLWNGVDLGSPLINAGAFGYTNYSYNVVATGSDTISFNEASLSGNFALDDISLDLTAAPTGAPEPLTASLFAAGLLGLGLGRRRKLV